jgi:hypothetical protein
MSFLAELSVDDSQSVVQGNTREECYNYPEDTPRHR